MSIWSQVTGPARAHWRRVLSPAGVAITSWGNALYDTPYRWPGLVLFISGLVLMKRGVASWKGFTDGWQAPKRIRHWTITTFQTPEWERRWWALKLTAWGLIAFRYTLYPLFLSDRIVAAPDQLLNHEKDALQMLAFSFLFPLFTRWIQPKDNLLERLEGRVLRAMASRTLANFNAASAAAVLLYTALSMLSPDNVKVLPALTVTIGIATVVATHKMWTRYRKLCTQAHKNIQALIRTLEKPTGGGENQSAIQDAWDTVERDLRTRADTGYGFGARFVPEKATAALGEAMETVWKGLPGHQEARDQALADLQVILGVCAQRIDSVA
ncbi:hypothetical protein [Streptomyces vilmorinianum]|uniref:hypothetical protein n=1 Tax=Streptomyces vilmorinianum TaxID=3051092 RepID=UPI0010FB7EFB|nr:hypothetical protein [Streptomyces vilmorinianum]